MTFHQICHFLLAMLIFGLLGCGAWTMFCLWIDSRFKIKGTDQMAEAMGFFLGLPVSFLIVGIGGALIWMHTS